MSEVAPQDVGPALGGDTTPELLETLLTHTSDGVAITDGRTGRVLRVNDALAALTGRPADELVDATLTDLGLAPRDDGASAPGVTRLVLPDASARWVEHRTIALAADAATVTFVRDITEREQTQRALAESERRAQQFLDCSRDVICRVSLDGRLLYVSPASAEVLGFEPEELIGRPAVELTHPDDAEMHRARLREIAVTGSSDSWQRRQRRKDGSYVWVEVWARLVRDGEGGGEIVASMRDVSARRAAEDELRVSEERNRLVIEAVTDYAIFMLDPEGNVASWSPGAERINGYTAQEIVGRHFSVFYTPEDIARDHPQTELRQALQTGRYEESGPRVRKDGSRFWANVTITPIHDRAGALRGFAKVTHDDTARSLAESALRESEWRFRQVMETIDEAFVLRSVNPLEVIYASPSVQTILGIPLERVYESPAFLMGLVHPDERERLRCFYEGAAAAEGADFEFELAPGEPRPVRVPAGVVETRIVRPDGETRAIRVKTSTVREPDGALTRFAMAIEDVTDEVAVRERLAESQARLRAFVDNVPAAVVLTDTADTIVMVNALACEMAGEPAEAIVGRPFSSFRPNAPVRGQLPADDAQWRAQVTDPGAPAEVDWLDADGTVRAGLVFRFPIVAGGAEVGRGRVGFDVTELKRTERALRSSETRFRSIFESSRDGILLTTPEGDVIAANQAICAMLGRSADELVAGGRGLIVDRHDERLPVALERRGRIGHMRTGLTLMRSDGTRLPVDVTSSVFEDADGEPKTSVIVRDMTDAVVRESELRSARAEAEQANAAKSQFLSRMSHELRTPLNSVLGFGQLLVDQPLTERQARYVKRVLSAGRHLLELIDEVLDISRLESGSLSLSPEVTSLAPVVAEAVALVEPLAASRAITLDNRLDGEHEIPVLADVQRIKQVLLNLLSNAIKYNREGGSVTVAVDDADARTVRVGVTDTGAGIPEARAHSVFTPFDRLGAEDSDVPGTGLGLALSKSLMEAMGGTLSFTSTPGQGTTFWIGLRRGQSTGAIAPRARFSRSVSGAASALDGRTVLLIENNEANHELVAEALTPRVRLITAMQAQVGLELAHAHGPDLILLDLHLPDLDGEQVLASLKAHPDTTQIPVIIVSADAGPSRQARLLAAGAEAYVPKPLDLHRLITVGAEALRHAAAGGSRGGEDEGA